MKLPFRLPVPACIHAQTYKYFLEPTVVEGTWARLVEAFGEMRVLAGVGIRQIDGAGLIIRSVGAGNPITVLRTSACRTADVAGLHAILGFEESLP